MTAHSHDLAIPRGPIIGGAALVLATLAAVAAVRFSGVEITSRSTAPVVAERQLQFIDRADGGIDVREGGRVVQTVPPGQHGFLRGVLRALVRERRIAQAGVETPFRLAARADGRLTLEDPATGGRVDIESFGPTNADVFARLLAGQPLPPDAASRYRPPRPRRAAIRHPPLQDVRRGDTHAPSRRRIDREPR